MSYHCCGGHRVGYRQFLPPEIVVEGQPPVRSHRGRLGRDHSGADHLPRPQRVQYQGQGVASCGKRRIQQGALPCHRQGQHHAVGQRHALQALLRQHAGKPAQLLQRKGVHRVTVVGQQLGQFGLAHVASDHP